MRLETDFFGEAPDAVWAYGCKSGIAACGVWTTMMHGSHNANTSRHAIDNNATRYFLSLRKQFCIGLHIVGENGNGELTTKNVQQCLKLRKTFVAANNGKRAKYFFKSSRYIQ